MKCWPVFKQDPQYFIANPFPVLVLAAPALSWPSTTACGSSRTTGRSTCRPPSAASGGSGPGRYRRATSTPSYTGSVGELFSIYLFFEGLIYLFIEGLYFQENFI